MTQGFTGRGSSDRLAVLGVLAFLLCWSAASHFGPSGIARIPGIPATLAALAELHFRSNLVEHIALSLRRLIVGFSLAALVGVCLGLLAGSSKWVRALVLPANSFLRYVPPTAFLTLLIVYFGVGDGYKHAVVFFSVVFFILQMTVDVVVAVDKRYYEFPEVRSLCFLKTLRYVTFPAASPGIFALLRINFSASWTFLVAAEIVGADGGLGFLLALSQRFGRIEEMYACIVIFGCIGLLLDTVFRWIDGRAFSWLLR